MFCIRGCKRPGWYRIAAVLISLLCLIASACENKVGTDVSGSSLTALSEETAANSSTGVSVETVSSEESSEPLNISTVLSDAKPKASSAASTSNAATAPSDKIKEPYYSTVNIGSAKTFKGNCLFIDIFLSDAVSSFTEEEKQGEIAKLQEAELFFKQNAMKYGTEFSMIYNQKDLLFEYETDFIIPTEYSQYLRWGYDLMIDIYSQYSIKNIENKYRAENTVVLFHVNKTGRSYANRYEAGYDSVYSNESVVIFSSEYDTENNLIDTCASAYAHEILHMFGAIDLYYPFNPNDERIALAERYFPDDIMLITWYDINLCKIGELDAFLIGWADSLDEKHKVFLT